MTNQNTNKNKRIYFLDNAATTAVRPEVISRMEKFLSKEYANPASTYRFANSVNEQINDARVQVAVALGAAKAKEIYFTGSGTESDNWAIRGTADANAHKGRHIITTAFEHHAVMECCKNLEKHGFEVTYLMPDKNGFVTPAQVKEAIRPDTILISVIYANNEIGTIQPIAEIGKIAKDAGIIFHTDAVQAAGHIPIDVVAANIDLCSISAHKFYGPKGAGALYIKTGTKIDPLIFGGMQENNKRAGSHNTPGIIGMGLALELAVAEMEEEAVRLTRLRNKLIKGILNIPFTSLNGSQDMRLPGNVNVSFKFIESESVINLLDFKGICASSGSACNSELLEASHVLIAIGLNHEETNGTVRFTLGKNNTEEDIDYVLEALPPIIEKLRNMSPLYEDFLRSRG